MKAGRKFISLFLIWAIVLPATILSQTAIKPPKNKFKVEEDVKLGQQAVREIERELPILNDAEITRYVQSVGDRLIRAIPPELDRPEFRYSFKVVNLKEINAFALPGGPMYVNRGIIDVADNEGELAGVMAHEISHVVLRHATAQITKMQSPLSMAVILGSILGGGILGGDLGAQLGSIVASGYVSRYSREYETQSDILGAQIMARAGYDPNDLANMFIKIENESGGGRTIEWLSSHPDPTNRYKRIKQEAQYLSVSRNPIKVTPDFLRIKRKLQSIPPGKMQPRSGDSSEYGKVSKPSVRTVSYTLKDVVRFRYPANWEVVNESDVEVMLAPRGAYGSQGITHGVVVGVREASTRNLNLETEMFVREILQREGNDFLRYETSSRATVAGRNGLVTLLKGRSPVTKQTEVVRIYTTFNPDRKLFYVVTVAPGSELNDYDVAFQKLL
ncbi:MAG: M48 family metalloprotease, partial [Pyrinomonadaceae bacterium]